MGIAARNFKGPFYALGCVEYTVRVNDTATLKSRPLDPMVQPEWYQFRGSGGPRAEVDFVFGRNDLLGGRVRVRKDRTTPALNREIRGARHSVDVGARMGRLRGPGRSAHARSGAHFLVA
jgi:hypothetical protein